jgi:hypothetical protein
MIRRQKKIEDTNEVIRGCNWKKDTQYSERKRKKRQSMICKTLHRKLQIG